MFFIVLCLSHDYRRIATHDVFRDAAVDRETASSKFLIFTFASRETVACLWWRCLANDLSKEAKALHAYGSSKVHSRNTLYDTVAIHRLATIFYCTRNERKKSCVTWQGSWWRKTNLPVIRLCTVKRISKTSSRSQSISPSFDTPPLEL